MFAVRTGSVPLIDLLLNKYHAQVDMQDKVSVLLKRDVIAQCIRVLAVCLTKNLLMLFKAF